MINNLNSCNRNLGSKYITVMYSTEPLFLSVVRTQYLKALSVGGITSVMDGLKALAKSDKEIATNSSTTFKEVGMEKILRQYFGWENIGY